MRDREVTIRIHAIPVDSAPYSGHPHRPVNERMLLAKQQLGTLHLDHETVFRIAGLRDRLPRRITASIQNLTKLVYNEVARGQPGCKAGLSTVGRKIGEAGE